MGTYLNEKSVGVLLCVLLGEEGTTTTKTRGRHHKSGLFRKLMEPPFVFGGAALVVLVGEAGSFLLGAFGLQWAGSPFIGPHPNLQVAKTNFGQRWSDVIF